MFHVKHFDLLNNLVEKAIFHRPIINKKAVLVALTDVSRETIGNVGG